MAPKPGPFCCGQQGASRNGAPKSLLGPHPACSVSASQLRVGLIPSTGAMGRLSRQRQDAATPDRPPASFEPKSSWPGLETPAAFDVIGFAKTLAGRNEHNKVAYGG